MWEGIGVVSYLLINFWFTRLQANKAAILAFSMNRLGDMGLSIGFFACFALFGSLDYATVFSLAPFMNNTAVTIIGLLLLSGAMAKSSQIPLHSWLPGSMEGLLTNVKPNFNWIFIAYFICFSVSIFINYLLLCCVMNDCTIDFNETLIMEAFPAGKARDSKGRFISWKQAFVPLAEKVNESMIGSMLSDGIRDSHIKIKTENPEEMHDSLWH